MYRIPGFTLIELMVTLAVLAIAVTVAVPSYNALTTNNRMAGKINEFVASLHFVRSEAIKRGIPARLCRSNNDPPTCNSPTGGWEQGWIAVVMDGVGATPGTVLKDYAAFDGDDRLTGNTNVSNRIQFDRNGFALGGNNGTFILCDSEGNQDGMRAVIVSTTGRVALAQDSNNDDIVENSGGANLTCP